MHTANDSRIVVALDFPNARTALRCARGLDPSQCRVKVGKQLYTAAPQVVRLLVKMGYSVFLDLKYHDIPNTVYGAVRAAADIGVWMVNVHAEGGPEMLGKAARAVVDSQTDMRVIAVTVLTTMDKNDLQEVGTRVRSVRGLVLTRARLASEWGLHGVVASPLEARAIRRIIHPNFLIVTPGIRLPDGNVHDQKRVGTPEYAMQNGADYLVVGRPITEALIPGIALQNFNDRVRTALGN